MADSDKRISLKIDINSGIIEIDAPVESFDQAIEKTRELTDSLDLGKRMPASGETANGAERTPLEKATSGRERGQNKSSKPSSSTGRSGRLGSFNPIRDLLTEEQEKSIREFKIEKAPVDQSDEILICMHQGEELLGKQGLNYNEIYTLMWRAGIEPLPKALDVVLQRLMKEQSIERGNDGYVLKFLGRQRVERELPLPAKDAA